MKVYVVSGLLSFLIFTLLWVYILWVVPRRRVNMIFASLLFFLSCWSLGKAIGRLYIEDIGFFWAKFGELGLICALPLLVHFTFVFPGGKILRKRYILPLYFLSSVWIALLFVELFTKEEILLKTVRIPYFIYQLVFICLAMLNLTRTFFKSKSLLERTQVKIVLIAVSVSIFIAIPTIILNILYKVDTGEPATFPMIFSCCAIVYAIRKRKLPVITSAVMADTIIATMADFLTVVNTENGTIAVINQATLDLLGYKEDELIGQPVSMFFEEDSIFNLLDGKHPTGFKGPWLEKLIKEGVVYNYNTVYRTKDGKEIPVSLNSSVIRDKQGKIVGIASIARDMRKIRKLIAELESSRTEIEEYSETLEESVAERTEELSKTVAKLTDFRDATIYMLTDLDKTTKALEKAKDYTDNIIKSMIDTLIVVDSDGKIKTINRATEELLGYKGDELIGQSVGMMFEEEEEEDLLFKGTRLEKLLKEGSVRDYDMAYLTKGKERIPVDFNGSVMRDKDGNLLGIVGVARDMREIKRLMQKEKEFAVAAATAETEKKRASELNKAYQELRETQAKLIQAGRLAALGTLGAGIAHQLNQPLTGIRLFAQIMETRIDKNNPLGKDLDQIIEQTKYMADIIDNIQGFARPGKIKRKPIDINEPIEKSLQLASEQLKAHKIVLLKNLDPDLPKVNAAANQMQQIFLNFITNAREAMDSMPEEAIKNLRITTRLGTKNNFVEIIFQDTGPGIPEDIKDRIFDPFFTTKGPSSTGLGLSLSHGIIRDHSGTIGVNSRQGKGTTFIVRLPAHVK